MIAYRVYVGDYMILDTHEGLNDGIVAASMNLEVNQPGSFEFTVLSTHPRINEMKPYIKYVAVRMSYYDASDIERDYYIPFFGRIISTEKDIYGNMSVSCEGALSFFNDVPVSYYNGRWLTINSVISECCESLNTLGGHAVLYDQAHSQGGTDPLYNLPDEPVSDPQYEYITTNDAITQQVIDMFGGMLDFDVTIGSPSEEYVSGRTYSFGVRYYQVVDSLQYPYDHSKWPDGAVDGYGGPFPCFGINNNILDISSSPVKTDIWTGIIPIGKDGMINTTPGGTKDIKQANVRWDLNMRAKYGRIIKTVDFSDIEGPDTLSAAGLNYVKRFDQSRYIDMMNYSVSAIEPCEVFGNVEVLTRLGYSGYLRTIQHNSDFDPSDYGDVTYEVNLPCLSIKHNLFDIQKSQYTFGPLIPENEINEDMSAYGIK